MAIIGGTNDRKGKDKFLSFIRKCPFYFYSSIAEMYPLRGGSVFRRMATFIITEAVFFFSSLTKHQDGILAPLSGWMGNWRYFMNETREGGKKIIKTVLGNNGLLIIHSQSFRRIAVFSQTSQKLARKKKKKTII